MSNLCMPSRPVCRQTGSNDYRGKLSNRASALQKLRLEIEKANFNKSAF
jgi:hypothetical protein